MRTQPHRTQPPNPERTQTGLQAWQKPNATGSRYALWKKCHSQE